MASQREQLGNGIIVMLPAILDDRDINEEWRKRTPLLFELRILQLPMRVLLIDKMEYTLQE
jgi:hypothetical protein